MPKYCIYTWFGFPIETERSMQLIQAAGFDGVLLWWSDESSGSDGDNLVQLEFARRLGLYVENIHTPFQDANNLWKDDSTGEHFADTLARCITDCGEYEIPTAVIHVSEGANPPPPGRIGLDRLKRLVGLAESKQVNLALENLCRPDYLDFVFSRIQSERLGFCYDSGHANCYRGSEDLLTRYGPKLMALHLHDNDGTGDQHRIPGEGSIDWRKINAGLQQIGYRGAISLEVIKTMAEGDIETPERYLERAFAATRDIFHRVKGVENRAFR